MSKFNESIECFDLYWDVRTCMAKTYSIKIVFLLCKSSLVTHIAQKMVVELLATLQNRKDLNILRL